MILEVTQTEIDNGQPNLCTLCAFALALERRTGERWFVSGEEAVPLRQIRNLDYPLVMLPEAAREWILRCDRGEPVGPITVELDL